MRSVQDPWNEGRIITPFLPPNKVVEIFSKGRNSKSRLREACEEMGIFYFNVGLLIAQIVNDPETQAAIKSAADKAHPERTAQFDMETTIARGITILANAISSQREVLRSIFLVSPPVAETVARELQKRGVERLSVTQVREKVLAALLLANTPLPSMGRNVTDGAGRAMIDVFEEDRTELSKLFIDLLAQISPS